MSGELTDFSQDENRREMAHAIAAIAEALGQQEPLWINGEAVRAKETPIHSINPADPSEIVARFPAASAELVQAALDTAEIAGAVWRAVPGEERGRRLNRVADSLEPRRLELAAWLCFEAGMPWRTADREVAEAIAEIRAAADGPPTNPDRVAVLEVRAPDALKGIAHLLTTELRAGSTVLVRPDSSIPLVVARLVEAFHWEAELPPGVVNFAPRRGDGAWCHSRFAQGLDAAALDDALERALSDSGQQEMPVFLVDPADYDATLQRLRDALAELRVGAGIDFDTDIGPMRTEELQTRALAVPGAADGEFPNDSGYWVQPTLIEGAVPDLPLGPFVQVVPVSRADWRGWAEQRELPGWF